MDRETGGLITGFAGRGDDRRTSYFAEGYCQSLLALVYNLSDYKNESEPSRQQGCGGN